jgi:hypothetical protein
MGCSPPPPHDCQRSEAGSHTLSFPCSHSTLSRGWASMTLTRRNFRGGGAIFNLCTNDGFFLQPMENLSELKSCRWGSSASTQVTDSAFCFWVRPLSDSIMAPVVWLSVCPGRWILPSNPHF